MLHYTAKDAYEPIVIAPYFDRETGNLTVWATSDLWDSVSGKAEFQWYDWEGEKLSISGDGDVPLTIGAINSTKVFQMNTTEALKAYDEDNAILRMQVSTTGKMPNSDVVQTFKHENWFHPRALKYAKLVDPGLELSYDSASKNFSITATKGMAAWVWLDYPSGAVVHFDSNGFWLAKDETRMVGYTVQKDETYGTWVDGVTVESMWNQTLAM